MSLQRRNQEEVHIFWDYDTTRTSSASNGISTYDVVKNIRTAVNPFGPVKSFRAYSDFSSVFSLPRSTNFRSELSSSGVTLIDCPGDGRKDLNTKILLVDLILNAWDNPPPRTFVIITGDRDLAYAVSILRMRNFKVVVICPATTHLDLTAQASAQLDWSRVILGFSGELADLKPAPGPLKESPLSSFMTRRQTSETANDTQTVLTLRKSMLGSTQQPVLQTASNPEPPPTNYQDSQPRARRNSLFSTFDSSKFNVFDDDDDDDLDPELATPTVGIGPFGFGDGPLFSRPRSRADEQARADSAPPNIQYSTSASTPRVSSSYLSFPEQEIPEVPPLMLKGKQKETEIPEQEPGRVLPPAPQEIQPLPQAPQEPIMTSPPNIMYSDSIFEPFGGMAPFTNPAYSSSVNPSGTPPLIRSMSSLSTTSQTSLFSTMMHIDEVSSAPTSAEPRPFVEKSDSTIKPFSFDKGSPPKVHNGNSKPISSTWQGCAPLKAEETKSADTKANGLPKVHIQTQTSPAQTSERIGSTKITPPVDSKAPRASSSKVAPSETHPEVVTGPSNAISSSTQVPPKFAILVAVLREEQQKYKDGVSKPSLGGFLLKRDPAVYKTAQCAKLSQYIALALAAGVVVERVNARGEHLVALSPQYV